MTLGWVEITVDGKPAMVRICYVRAWNDPAWMKVNGRGRKDAIALRAALGEER